MGKRPIPEKLSFYSGAAIKKIKFCLIEKGVKI